MCGIAGFVLNKRARWGEGVIRDMLDSLRARGPEGTSWLSLDGEGTQRWTRESDLIANRPARVAIGCSRLALNDPTDSGLQPLPSTDRTIWTALNGEVFNFHELRGELEELGYVFRTRTDTEVVSNAYHRWGQDCFARFNGQFAIALYDSTTGELILARDRIGITPLFYRHDTTGLVFGSEIKAILRTPGTRPGANPRMLARHIGLPYKLHQRPDASMFSGILPVRPGGLVVVDMATLQKQESAYWSAQDFAPPVIGSFQSAKEQLRDLLIDAVHLRLRTDRKYAFILSGGIDSPSVLGIAKTLFGIEPATFSLDLPDTRFNENPSIREVLQSLNLPESFVEVLPQTVVDLFPQVVTYADEPLATPNAVLHGLLARHIAASDVKVVLNGVGGDESLFGYHDHFLYHLHQLRAAGDRRFEAEREAWSSRQDRAPELLDDFERFLADENARHSPDFLARSRGFDYRDLLQESFRAEHLDTESLFDAGDGLPRTKQVQDLTQLTVPHAVRMDDNCYLSQAVEARQPFLDHRIVEFGLTLPSVFKIRRGFGKFILRQAIRGLVPDTRRRDARKIGLNLPIDQWMRGPLKSWIDTHLADSGNPLYGFADFDRVQTILRRHQHGDANHSLKIWDLCCVNDWLVRFA